MLQAPGGGNARGSPGREVSILRAPMPKSRALGPGWGQERRGHSELRTQRAAPAPRSAGADVLGAFTTSE